VSKIIKILLIGTLTILYGFGNYSLAAITKVNVDFTQNKIIINGENISYAITDSVLVTLGDINLLVCGTCYSATEITADLPVGLLDGDYMLKISSFGKAYIDSDPGLLYNEYNLTIGAVGLTGLQGIQGEPGIQGEQGLPGADGSNGVDGAPGLPGADGAQGIQGVKGDQGIQGLTGATGPEGPPGPQGLPGADGVDGLDSPIANINCSTDQIIKYNGTAWVCSDAPLTEPSPGEILQVKHTQYKGTQSVFYNGENVINLDITPKSNNSVFLIEFGYSSFRDVAYEQVSFSLYRDGVNTALGGIMYVTDGDAFGTVDSPFTKVALENTSLNPTNIAIITNSVMGTPQNYSSGYTTLTITEVKN
jgi:Collagen triple helix repeat (20 copies)